MENSSLIVSLRSPPINGKANRELVAILPKKYGLRKSHVVIKSGLSTKTKIDTIFSTTTVCLLTITYPF